MSYIQKECAVSQVFRAEVATYDERINIEDSREHIMQNYIGHIEWRAISKEDKEKEDTEGDVPSNIMINSLLFGEKNYEKVMCIAVN